MLKQAKLFIPRQALKTLGQGLWIAGALLSNIALAQETTPSSRISARLDVQVSLTNVLQRPLNVQGTIVWQNLPANKFCIFTPYNDSDYGFEHTVSRHMELMGQKFYRPLYLGASTNIQFKNPSAKVQKLAAHLWEVETTDDSLTIDFESSVPWLANSSNDDWFYDGFYPQVLQTCPNLSTRTIFYSKPSDAQIDARFKLPADWEIAAPGVKSIGTNEASISVRTAELVFALVKGYKRLNYTFEGVPVHLLFKSDSFLQMLPTIEGSIKSHADLFGTFPFPDLWIIESSELQRANLPGIIAINKPRQAAFNVLQSKYLNWAHWNVVTLLAGQWFGASVRAHNPDYHWLIDGIADFAALEALRSNNKRYNLMNIYDVGYFGVSLNYLQVQDLTAALLNRAEPLVRLTNADFQSVTPFVRQHPLLFIKQSIALRHMSGDVGAENFGKFAKTFFKDHEFSKIKARDLLTSLQKLPSPFSPQKRLELSNILKAWYVNAGWPDFAVENFTSERLADGRWIAKAEAQSLTDFVFPTPIRIIDEDGRKYHGIATTDPKTPRLFKTQILTRAKPQQLIIDADHHYFDQNRFNNHTGWPAVHFFPGSANSFADDSYTIVWLPYPFRRPGESFAIGLQAAIFRYLSGNVFLKIETEVDDGDTAFLLQNTQRFPDIAAQMDLSAEQNVQGYRVADISFTHTPALNWHQTLGLGVSARHKQVAGVKNSSHQTVAAKFIMRPTARYDFCQYNLNGEYEHAPKQKHTDFSYDRRFLVLLGTCNISSIADLSLRLFRGEITSAGTPSPDAFFEVQNLEEARLRLDMRGLRDVRKIGAASVDLAFPLMVPLPDNLLILNRRTKWRLFYDYGQALDQPSVYRAAGGGFLLPFGGDLSGAGSLTLTQLSLIAVLYSQAEGQTSRDMRILFDISGQL